MRTGRRPNIDDAGKNTTLDLSRCDSDRGEGNAGRIGAGGEEARANAAGMGAAGGGAGFAQGWAFGRSRSKTGHPGTLGDSEPLAGVTAKVSWRGPCGCDFEPLATEVPGAPGTALGESVGHAWRGQPFPPVAHSISKTR
jgi:hypothetical protein